MSLSSNNYLLPLKQNAFQLAVTVRRVGEMCNGFLEPRFEETLNKRNAMNVKKLLRGGFSKANNSCKKSVVKNHFILSVHLFFHFPQVARSDELLLFLINSPQFFYVKLNKQSEIRRDLTAVAGEILVLIQFKK